MLGALVALAGCYAILRREALIGDALGHAVLPGVTAAFLLGASRNSPLLILGALLSTTLAYFAQQLLVRTTTLKPETVLAITLSLFFALGVFQLSIIQHRSGVAASGLEKILFGQAAALTSQEVWILAVILTITLIILTLLHARFTLISFDRNFAKSSSLPLVRLEIALGLILLIAIIFGAQLVGVILVSALLIIPGLIALFWCKRVPTMMLLASIVGSTSGAIGAQLSYAWQKLPTGAVTVIVLALIFLISLIFAPKNGLLAKYLTEKKQMQIADENNLLKAFFKLFEQKQVNFNQILHFKLDKSEIAARLRLNKRRLEAAIQRLVKGNFLFNDQSSLLMSEKGAMRGQRQLAFHRLWESYLNQEVGIASDHVHQDAEEVEHFISDTIASQIKQQLSDGSSKKLKDPHGKIIPPVNDAEDKKE
jgi:manganese/zinc/iron transport system permease protein